MAQDERYNGYTNYETWCVALWINNDQGWQESVHEELRAYFDGSDFEPDRRAFQAGGIIRENVEQVVCYDFGREDDTMPANLSSDLVGRALDRVDWIELGETFLADLAEQEG